jgi:hypothetical protein
VEVAGVDIVIVEIVIALAFVFFLLSIIASAINELIASVFKVRARMLEQGVASLLTGKRKATLDPLVRKLFHHPLVVGYSRADGTEPSDPPVPTSLRKPSTWRTTPNGAPSYLASRSFRNALLDRLGLLAATAPSSAGAIDEARIAAIRAEIAAAIEAIDDIPGIDGKQVQATLQTIWLSVDRDAKEFRAGVERWFDRGMERVSGWYKRRSQVILWVLGGVLAVGVNVNALAVADTLWRDAAVRDALVARVEAGDAGSEPASGTDAGDGAAGTVSTEEPSADEPESVDDGSTDAVPITADDALDRLEASDLPIGWSGGNGPDDWGNVPASIAGWLLTAAAVSLGAPFWFDVLNKAANLRAAGKKPATTLLPPDD